MTKNTATRNTVVALVAAASLGSIALPALAAPAPEPEVPLETATVESTSDFDADRTLTLLQQEGVRATAVEKWRGLVRAFVIDENGQQAMRYFDPDTLAPVLL